MQSLGSSTVGALTLANIPPLAGVTGQRAVVEFSPNPTSPERLCAGIVTRLDSGEVSFTCALDSRKTEHAFGATGTAFYAIAYQLCESLAQHWRTHTDAHTWNAPFEGARLAELARFSATDSTHAHLRMLSRTSSLHTLMQSYEIQQATRNTGIVARVRSAVGKDSNAKHLAKRFNRELSLGADAQALRVDFLGQHFACYFLQLTRSTRGIDSNTERAFGKLFELQALQRFIKKPRKSLGLLDDERPNQFELVMVGERSDSVQRRAIYQVEALADKGQIIARTVSSAAAAAGHVADRERLAA